VRPSRAAIAPTAHHFYHNNIALCLPWSAPALHHHRAGGARFLTKMYRANQPTYFRVHRDSATFRAAPATADPCAPDDVPAASSYVVWRWRWRAGSQLAVIHSTRGKDLPEKIPFGVRHINTFLKATAAVAAMEQRAALTEDAPRPPVWNAWFEESN